MELSCSSPLLSIFRAGKIAEPGWQRDGQAMKRVHIRASPMRILFSTRHERQPLERRRDGLISRWFVGPGVDAPLPVTVQLRTRGWSQGREGST